MEKMMNGTRFRPDEPGKNDPVPWQRGGSPENKERRPAGTQAAPDTTLIGGPVAPRDTHWPLAEEFAERFGTTWKWVREAKAWYSYRAEGIWEQNDHIGSTLRLLLRERAAELRGSTEARAEDRARALDHVSVTNGVESLLKRLRCMTCSVEDFDSQPYLMNKPERVYDLRDGRTLEHSPELMMRWATAVAPSVDAIVLDKSYRELAPKWFAVLDHLANGRDWFIPGVRAALAYTLS